jgi:peptidoglycan/xylan/chitin deacetylase (PgdA/CDA1 family)
MKQINKLAVFIIFTTLILVGLFLFSTATHNKPEAEQVVLPKTKTPSIPQVAATKNIQTDNSLAAYLHVPVLMYHHVGNVDEENLKPDAVALDLTVSPGDFESQVKYFKDLGYESITVQQLYNSLVNGTKLPAKPIVFSFDDGYKDVFTNAVPILRKYGYSGSFAIATELLGRPSYAVWDDVLAAQSAGEEIISHTENHLDLSSTKYSDDDLRREIDGSKKILEEKLGHSVDFFVFPYGKYDSHVLDMVKSAGYKMAFTTAYGQDMKIDSLLTEPRVRVHGQDGLEKLKKLFEPLRTVSVRTSR